MLRPPLARAFAAAIAATTAMLGAIPAAFGEQPSSAVVWDAASPECPDQAYVRRAVDQLLGGDGPAPAARVEARAHVSHAGQWQVKLTIVRDGTTGERAIESSSCRSLADATALIVALTIDPERVAANRPTPNPGGADAGSTAPPAPATEPGTPDAAVTTPPPPPAPALPPPPPPPPALTPPPPPTPTPTPAPPPNSPPFPPSSVALLASFAGDIGTLPQPAPGLALGAALLFRTFRVEGYGAFWPSQTAHAPTAPTFGGDVSLADGGIRACWLPVHGRLELAACPGLELGDLHGQGKGVRSPAPNDGVWFAATALARATWRLAPSFGVFLDLGLVIPFIRDQFALDQIGTIHQAGFVEGRASIGPELRF
jgi:hypothetical protein